MTNDEQVPLSLPDTQNADGVTLTQSQDALSSQETMKVWGRLYPDKIPLRVTEMTKDEYTLGRSDRCDICVTSNDLKMKWLSVISKVHFRIIRDRINNTNDSVVYLEDLSHNGTFVNKRKVGRGNRVVLENNDVISMAQPIFSVYIYMSATSTESIDLPTELKDKYAVSRKLGSGACGEVRLVLTKVGCERFAMKTIPKIGLGANGQKHPLNDPAKIMNEVKILKALRHPCVIRMQEIVDTPSMVYIVLELMEGGELLERITSQGRLTEPIAKILFYQVILAVHYLHERGITHRDLKPENILLASNTDITLAKVSDFGLSKFVDAQTMMKTFCGTPMYVAPEILQTNGCAYTKQVDVWSLGVILYACLSGSVPFNANHKVVPLQDQIKRGAFAFPPNRFGHVSEKAIDLIKRMMTVNPNKRITVKQIILHPWLQDRQMRDTIDVLLNGGNDENTAPSNHLNNEQRVETYNIKRARIES